MPESLHVAMSASEVTAVVMLEKEGPLSWGMSPLVEEKCEDVRTFLIKATERSAEVQGGVELVEPGGLIREGCPVVAKQPFPFLQKSFSRPWGRVSREQRPRQGPAGVVSRGGLEATTTRAVGGDC